MKNTTLAVPSLPERWITEIAADGVVRHVQRIPHDHIVIRASDIPGLMADRLLVSDDLADRVFNSLIKRAG